MSNKVAIVTDSTAYLPEDCLKQYHITIIPLSVIWGEDTYRDGVDISPGEFYIRLTTSKTMPTTSQVTPGVMQETFKSLLDQGYDVLGIFLSSRISGTYESAVQALDLLGNVTGKVELVDSLWTTMGMGWPVLTAARAADAGESLSECKKITETACANTGVLFVVETLEFLRRGGRIGGAQALLGTALNLKPILEIREGRIESVERIRTKHKAIQRVVEIVTERIQGRGSIRLAATHASCESDAAVLLDLAHVQLNPVETMICPLSPVIGTHAGPGTIALNYMSGIS
jgi:DegV family protein with EDD domain